MALIIKDRVKESTTSTGTGAVSLGGASATFDTFQSVMSNGDTTYYAIVHTGAGTDEWEVGLGTWNTGNTFTRTTVLSGSNGTSAVNFSSGSKDVFMTYPADKAVFFNADGDVDLNRDPQTALQAATKQYVDTIAAAGLHYHDPVRVEQEGNLSATYDNGTSGVGATLTNNSTQAALVIDGVTLSLNDRVLIYEQTNAYENGIYTVTDVGSASTNWELTRSTDTDSYAPSDPDSLGQGDAFFVLEGTAGAGELYVMNTEGSITFGTTAITFTQVAATAVYTAGDGLTLTGTEFAVGAGTGVTVNTNDISIGQDVGTTSNVTFNTVTADLTGDVTGNLDGIVGGTTPAAGSFTNVTVSGTVDGRDVAADGTKLDGIESGATADQTASEILTALLGVDGASSNLDADLLDGQHGSYYLSTTGTAANASLLNSLASSQFLRSDVADTKTAGDLSFADSVKLSFGAGSDLQIYHDGSNSFIDEAGTGNLRIRASSALNLQTRNTADTAWVNSIIADDGAGVRLFTNGSKKLETTSTGIDVTGTVTADGLTVNGEATFGTATGVFPDEAIFVRGNNGTSGYINGLGVGNSNAQFRIFADDTNNTAGSIKFDIRNRDRVLIEDNGDISFYEDTGTTAKFFWDASAESLGIGTTSPAIAAGGGNPELTISGTVSYFNLQGNRTAGAGNTTGQITSFNNSTAISRLATVLDSGTTDGAMLFSTASSGSLAERMRIDSSGRVGIGTPYANVPLHVFGGTNNTSIAKFTGGQFNRGLTISTYNSGSLNDGGVSFNADDSVRITISNSEKMRIDSSGNVGINTSAQTEKLVVEGAIASTYQATNFGLGDYRVQMDIVDSSKLARIGTITGTATPTGSEGTVSFLVNSSEKMRIDTSGNVGIGTTTPSTPLHIKDSNGGIIQTIESGTNGNAYTKYINSTTGSGAFTDGLLVGLDTDESATFWQYEANHMKFGTNSIERMRIDSSGNVGINTTSPSALLEALGTDASIIVHNSGQSRGGIAAFQTQRVGLVTTSTNDNIVFGFTSSPITSSSFNEKMRIDNGTGNVGIGTTSPGRTLDINGAGAGGVVGIKGGTNNQVNIAHSSNSSWGLLLGNSDSSNNSDYHYSTSGANLSTAIINVNNDALHLGTNNAPVMTINHSGNVSIGVNTTSYGKLDVYREPASGWTRSITRNAGGAAFTGVYKTTSTNSPGIFAHNATLSAWADLWINAHNNGSGGVAGGTSNNIIMAGKVGINTASPDRTLVVAGTTRLGTSGSARSTSGVAVNQSVSTAWTANADLTDGNRMFAITNDSTATGAMANMSFRVNPNNSTYNTMVDLKLVSNGASQHFTTTIRNPDAAAWVDTISIYKDGNIGIRTVAPKEELHVNGNIYVEEINGIVRPAETTKYANFPSGLVYRYYSNASTSTHPSDRFTLTQRIKNSSGFVSWGVTSTVNNFTFSTDYYHVEFHGYYWAPTEGLYGFGIDSDDASDFYIDGVRVADFYGGHGTSGSYQGYAGGIQNPGEVYLQAGWHKLYARFSENSGGDSCTLWHKEPSGSYEIIPADHLYHSAEDLIRAGTGVFQVYGTTQIHDGSLQEEYRSLSGTSPTCDPDTAGAFSLTMTGNTTFTFGGTSSGWSSGFIIQLTGNGSTVTWPSSVDWAGGTAPDAPASGETDILVFWTRNGGSTWYGALAVDAAA